MIQGSFLEAANLPAVSIVELFGTRREEVSIQVSEEQLRRYNLSFNEVATAIRNHSINQSLMEIGALSLDRLQGDLREFVDMTALHEAWQTFRTGGFDDNLNRALYLSIWLQENSRRPVVSDQEIL